MIGLVGCLVSLSWGGGAAPLSIFEGGQFGDCLIMVNLGKLRRPCPCCVTRRAGETGERFVVVLTGDPDEGTVREAGCLGENHRVRLVDLFIVDGRGASPAPSVTV